MIDEGYIKFESHWDKSGALSHPEIRSLTRWREPLYAAGLIGHYADIDTGYGNISTRIGETNQFIISGTQTGHVASPGAEHFAFVTDYDIASNAVHSTGAAEASSESMTHAAIYELDPKIRAVVHVHSEKLWLGLRGRVPTTDEQIDYGTPEMARELSRLFHKTEFSETGVAVMAGHHSGLVTTGRCLQEAAERVLSLHESL